MSDICIPAYHFIWEDGDILDYPIWSNMIQGYVVMFKPHKESFSLLVPVDELNTD